MVNRTAQMLRYKEPAIQWINDADPVEGSERITEKEVNEDRSVYLITSADGKYKPHQEAWIKKNYRNLFESELEGWYTDPDLWPDRITLKLFQEWFDTEFHSVIIDTVDEPLFDDGF